MNEYKLVVMGSGGVGKSALTVRFVNGVFVETYDPTIEDSYRKKVEVLGHEVVSEILDTAGTEQFTGMRSLYIKNGHGFILVFSLTRESSLSDITAIIESIATVRENKNIPVILVGNKCDLEDERKVSADAGKKFAEAHNCVYMEASAKSGINVNEIFMTLLEKIISSESTKKKKKKSGCNIF